MTGASSSSRLATSDGSARGFSTGGSTVTGSGFASGGAARGLGAGSSGCGWPTADEERMSPTMRSTPASLCPASRSCRR
ncbi:hypothetical protein ACFS3C_26670 [Azotobacter vinelandii]